MRRGLFITFEGPEGGGKTTQAARLADRLRQAGREIVAVREPGGTPLGEAIRAILQHDAAGEPPSPEAEVLLFAASRAQLVRSVILPALERGALVVCDRFADSTTVYQGCGRQLGMDRMQALNVFAIDGAEPDLTFLLDLPVETGFARLDERRRQGGRPRDRIEREDPAFHGRVRQGYLELSRRHPARFRVVDAGLPPEAVAEAIWKEVAVVLGR